MMKKNSYSAKTINTCCSKYKSGVAVKDIVNEIGVPRSTVYYWLKKYRDIETAEEITYKKAYENLERNTKKNGRFVKC